MASQGVKHFKVNGGLLRIRPRLLPYKEAERENTRRDDEIAQLRAEQRKAIDSIEKQARYEVTELQKLHEEVIARKRKEPPAEEKDEQPLKLPLPIEFEGEERRCATLSSLCRITDADDDEEILYFEVEKRAFNLVHISSIYPVNPNPDYDEDKVERKYQEVGAQCVIVVGTQPYYLLHDYDAMKKALATALALSGGLISGLDKL